MSIHHSFIKSSVRRPVEDLLNEVTANVASATKTEPKTITDLRKKRIEVDGEDLFVKRIYVQASNSGNLSNVGWVVNEGISDCLICQAKFGLFTGRHHCRSCGNLICNTCSANKTLLLEFESLGPQRICSNCTTTNTVGPTMLRRNERFGFSMESTIAERERTELAAGVAGVEEANEEIAGHVPFTAGEGTGNQSTSNLSDLTDVEANSVRGKEVSTPPVPEFLTISSPKPGFVIKTKLTSGNREKVFVNVLYHDSVEDPDLTLFQEPIKSVSSTDAEASAEPTDAGVAAARIVPCMYLSTTMTTTVDKEGQSSELYNVVVNSEYFSPSSVDAAVKVTDIVAVQKILRVINAHYSTPLNEEMFVFPKVKSGIKGDAIEEMTCVANTHEVDTTVTKCLQRSDSLMSVATVSNKETTTAAGAGAAPVPNLLSTQQASRRLSLRNSLLSTMGLGNEAHNTSQDTLTSAQDSTTSPKDGRTPLSGSSRRLSFFVNRQPSASELVNQSARPEVTAAMCILRDDLNISTEEAEKLKEESVEDTQVLLGWQILVKSSNDEEGTVYVVTATNKTLSRKTEFCLGSSHSAEIWAKLRRNATKTGLEFTPLRKVMYLPVDISDIPVIAE